MTREEVFDKAASLYGRLTGNVEKAGNLRTFVENGGMTLAEAVYVLRRDYEFYLDTTTCNMRDLVFHAGNGDLLLKFSMHTMLDEMLTRGELHEIYIEENERRRD